MGIPYLFQQYYKKYGGQNTELSISLHKLQKYSIQHLFFDYNSLIHPCAQQILSINYDNYIENNTSQDVIEDDIIENCIKYTKILSNSILTDTDETFIYIMIDGVAPRSKMNQQRERRYKSKYLRPIEESCEGKKSLWDSNKITPGTNFMKKLNKKLASIQCEFDSKLTISDSSEPGEGEHKMMNIINGLECDSKICIYGLDADLIMLSMLNKKSDNIILVRDNSFRNENNCIFDEIDFVDVSNLKEFIYNDIILCFQQNNPQKMVVDSFDKNRILNDYILLCFMLGNDFVHHIPSLNIKHYGTNNLIKAYVKAHKGNGYLTDKTEINLVYLKDLFYNLNIQETFYIKSNYNVNFNYSSSSLKNVPIEELNGYSVTNDKMSLFFYKQDNPEYDLYKNKKQYNDFYNLDLDDACYNYIEGLYWILGYYNSHSHCNWTWYYRYHNTPFASDIFNYLNKFKDIAIKIEKTDPVSNVMQLYMVLPRESLVNELNEPLNLLYKKSDNLINKVYNISSEKTNLIIDLTHCEYFWQSKVMFEFIDEQVLQILLE